MDDFFNIESLKKTCIRTFFKHLNQTGEQEGRILSEGCYSMEIRNQSDIPLRLTIADEIMTLQPRILDLVSVIDPLNPQVYHYDSLILPGQPYLVRSDIIEYFWGSPDAGDWNMLVIRHMVVEYQEGITYPVYPDKK